MVKNPPISLRSVSDIDVGKIRRFSIGDPSHVPQGTYAVEVLRHLGWYERLKDRLVKAGNARQALTYVEEGLVDLGLVYRTDAESSSKVQIVAAVDQSWHRPILYEAILLQRTGDMPMVEGARERQAHARHIWEALGSEAARKVWQRYGVEPF
jgi:molybdate transport system substrate-binding protein